MIARLFVFFVIISVFKNSQAGFIETYPPEGYESFIASRKSPVDIYYMGHFRMTVMAKYDLDTITFIEPQKIIEKISGVSNKKLVFDRLKQPFSINAELVCGKSFSPRCGQLQPDIAGVIFDESTFKVLLFINPDYLERVDKASDRFLPESDADLPGCIQGINLLATGSRGDINSNSWSLQGDTLVGWRENRIETNWGAGRGQASAFSTLFAAHDYAGLYYAGGYLSSVYNMSRFTYSRKIVGLQLGSSLQTYIDSDYIRTSPFDLFMPEDGVVEVYMEQRLISTQRLDAGNRLLDTRGFPAGSYDVLLVGRSQSGQELFRQTRFYIKRNRLPVNGYYDYFFELGDMTEYSDSGLPRRLQSTLVRGGWQQGIGPNTGIYTALAATNREQTGEVGIGHSFRKLWLEGGGLAGGQGQTGLIVSAELELNQFWIQAEASNMWNLPLERARSKYTEQDKPLSSKEKDQFLTGSQHSQVSASITRSIGQGNASLRHSKREDGGRSSYTNSVSYFVSLYQGKSDSLSLTTEFSRSNDVAMFRCSLSWNYSDLEWSNNVNSGYSREKPRQGKNNHSSSLGLSSNWNNYDEYRMANSSFSMGARFTDNSKVAEGSFSYGGEPGSGHVYLAHQESDQSKGSVYSMGLAGCLSLDCQGVAIGGAEHGSGQCVIVVIVEGATSSERFQVLINGYPRAFANGGDQVAVPLTAYATYKVSLRPVGNSVFDGIEHIEELTLYPGNVRTLTFELWTRKIVIGRLLDSEKQVLSDCCGQFGASAVCTDTKGIFQAEGRSNIRTINFPGRAGRVCNIVVPPVNDGELLLDLGDVVCD